MHEAYVVLPPATIQVQIESIAGFDKNLIIGTRQGHLLMFVVGEDTADKKMDLQLLQYDKNFSKKPIIQIDVIPEYQLLFSLSDNVINVNDISRHSFPLVHCPEATKGATIFALDIKRSKSMTGETALVVRMCVAIKRKLQFWYWKLDTLLKFGDTIDLADVPKALAWSQNTICVGYKTEYILYDLSGGTPEKRDLFPTSSSRTIDPCIALIDNLFAVAKDEYLIAVDPKSASLQDLNSTKNIAHDGNLSTSSNSGNLPSGSGSNSGITSNESGKSTVKSFKSLAWSQPLQVLVYDEPYAVALVHNSLEVRVLDSTGSNRDTFIQTLPELQKARFLIRARKGVLFAASLSQLWIIKSVEIPKQRQNLLQQKKFQLALQLTNISDESEDEKQEKKHQIQTLYAFDLFANKFFKESMKEFVKLGTDPCDVIRLFPDLLAQDAAKTSSNTFISSPKTNNLLKFEDRDLENGLLALIDYLREVRLFILSNAPEATKQEAKDSKNPLIQIIDTTLLKCYLQTNDSFVAPLLRLNYVHFEESEKTLKQYQKNIELIILYQTKGHHKKALQLLQSQADIPNSSLSGYERTIKYLQQLGNEHKQLIFEFANWVLEKHPEDGLKIFTEDIQEVENLARAEVLDYLLKSHKNLVISYLEHIIHIWNESKPIFHNILIQQYRERINEIKMDIQSNSANISEKQNQIHLENTRCKLIEFLKRSGKYTPENVLRNFPYDDLFEERAIILGKLGKHEKVLAIYIQILGDIDKAIEYCESIYQLGQQETSANIYVSLIRTLIIPPTEPPYSGVTLHPKCLKPNIETVLELLEKHAVKLNPYAVLQILPDNIPIFKLRTFLELTLNHQLERRRRNQVLKGLLYAENLQTQEQRMHHEAKFALVTDFSVCPVCKKKFTNQSAFVRYPNGEIVHFSCQEKE